MPDKVLVTREIPEAGLRVLEPFDVTVLHERPPERDELLEAVRGVSGVLSTATESMDAEVMDAAGENLRVIANMAVGYDNVDVEAGGEDALLGEGVRQGRFLHDGATRGVDEDGLGLHVVELIRADQVGGLGR